MNNMKEPLKQNTVYGLHPVMEAMNAGKEIEKIFIQKGLRGDTFAELMQRLKQGSIPYQFVPVEKLNRITRKNHQGVVAYISPVVFYQIEDVLPGLYEEGKTPFVILLDRITDVRNFGAILRTAECSGVNAVIIPSKNTAQLNSDTIKSSAGAIYKVPICRSENLKLTLDFLKQSGLRIAAATEKAEQTCFYADLTGPVALLLGSEGEGISGEYLKKADLKVKIPVLGEIESLNVSVAAGVLMYEVVRQRGAEMV
ncbi:MAG TPA: 23S rRNA (guanosine(2251)-2'-O)-methyltransferase RlmB [Bacteroidetes bacterium]|nr:23S rRNA (guanosine(2251)-2'-O)-methyltransferase RlmB [Bacteroidota bacterium]